MSASSKNTITINGKVYDARTGAVISHSGGAPHPTAPSIDGIVGGSTVVVKPHKTTTRQHRPVTSKAVHNKLHRPKTLKRDVVAKPSQSQHKPGKASTVMNSYSSAKVSSSPHRLSENVPEGRRQRASATPKSRLISKFGAATVPSVVKKHQTVHIKRAPVKPAKTAPTFTHPVVKSDRDILLDAALVKAVSHEQPKHRTEKRRERVTRKAGLSPRFVSIGAAVAVAVLIGAFFTYQNVPRFAMSIAASRAGIPASYPDYTPTGFAMQDAISYSDGKITARFSSREGDQSYTITQQASNWNSEALQADFIRNNKQKVQTREVNGRTVFVYEDTNATWVDGGIWYRVEGKTNLSTDQLLKLAASF